MAANDLFLFHRRGIELIGCAPGEVVHRGDPLGQQFHLVTTHVAHLGATDGLLAVASLENPNCLSADGIPFFKRLMQAFDVGCRPEVGTVKSG